MLCAWLAERSIADVETNNHTGLNVTIYAEKSPIITFFNKYGDKNTSNLRGGLMQYLTRLNPRNFLLPNKTMDLFFIVYFKSLNTTYNIVFQKPKSNIPGSNDNSENHASDQPFDALDSPNSDEIEETDESDDETLTTLALPFDEMSTEIREETTRHTKRPRTRSTTHETTSRPHNKGITYPITRHTNGRKGAW